MNTPALDAIRWPARKWAYAVVGVFVFQAALIVFLGERQRPPRVAPPFPVSVRVAPDSASAKEIEQTLGLSDPAAFALPTWTGFSREGWLAFRHPEFRLTEWTEPPQWLDLNQAALGRTLWDVMSNAVAAPLRVADLPLPRLTRHDRPVGNAPVLAQSELWVQGELAGWTLSEAVPLPSWPHTELLTNTVVHVVVDSSGHPVSTSLLARSGSADADQLAERIAREARFFAPEQRGRRVDTEAIASGKLVFKWHTLPATNTTAIGSP